jgi:hypothetical protein
MIFFLVFILGGIALDMKKNTLILLLNQGTEKREKGGMFKKR